MGMEVKYVGIGGSGVDYPCYEDDNGRLYFDTNFGRGNLDLHTGAYMDEFGDICGEPDRRVIDKVMLMIKRS